MSNQRKKVTLPIGNKKIFEGLAEIAWSAEDDKNPSEKNEFVNQIVYELGEEAFLFSFTPSGEIGDGHNTKENPISEAKAFYEEELEELFGPHGSITSILSKNCGSEKVLKTREMRFKASIISLIKLFVEVHGIDRKVMNESQKKNLKHFIASFFFISMSDVFSVDLREIKKMMRR